MKITSESLARKTIRLLRESFALWESIQYLHSTYLANVPGYPSIVFRQPTAPVRIISVLPNTAHAAIWNVSFARLFSNNLPHSGVLARSTACDYQTRLTIWNNIS